MQARSAVFLCVFLAPCHADFDITTNLTAGSIPNGTQLVGYIQDPNGRGTTTLVVSCVLTLVLCVWSALHLNVPRRQQTRLQDLWLNFRWIVTGIYAPELVVFTAWRQWCSARLLQQLVEQSLRDSEPIPHPAKCYTQWTMAHSFFACTGGFAFEMASLDRVILNSTGPELDRPQRLTLTARGMAILARCGHLPSVRREEIEDKSKANDLAKATVIIQATWMLIQVIGRLASKLPVTPLEVNTVAHVLCAFMMYLFWWNKPLLPNEPIIIDAEELRPLAAFMYSSSEMSGYVNPEQLKSQTVIKTLLAHLNLYSKTPEFETICLQPAAPELGDKPSASSTLTSVSPGSDPIDTDLKPPQLLQDPTSRFHNAPPSCISELQARREKEQGTAFFERRPRIVNERLDNLQPPAIDINRWSLIRKAFQAFPMLYEDRISMSHYVGGTPCVHFKAEQLVVSHVQNWPSNDLLRNVDGLVVGMVLWLANLCYGGIHAAGWNEHFPSTAESWLWRASAVYIGFCGGLWVVLNFVVAKIPALNEFWEHWMDGKKTWWQNLGLGVVVFLCGFSLVLARMFIVVEAVISVRELPAAVYQTPEWTDLFPHF